MTVADEGWIQDSLARLEELEQQKAQIEASGQSHGLAEIDAEIQALYQVLEAAADDGGEAAQDEAPPANEAPSPFAAPAAALDDASPFAAPAAAHDDVSPFAAPAEAPVSMAPPAAAMMESYGGDDVDVSPPRSATPFILLGILLVGGLGAGGWYMTQQQKAEEKPAPPPTEATVIQAGSIPDDTQEPDVAQGADADRTQGTRFKESNRPAPQRSASSGNKPRRSDGKKKSDDRKIVTDNSNDPLAGVK